MKVKINEQISNWDLERVEIKELNEQQVLSESTDEQTFSSGYHVPIWLLGIENLNGRTYPIELGERIVAENKVTYCLDGHPLDGDWTVRDIVAVGKNPVIENNILYIDLFFVSGEYEQKIKEMVKLNSFIGLSSAGLGVIEDDGTIAVDEYELERYCDLVITPAYGVFITKDNEKVKESVEDNSESTDEEIVENDIESADKDAIESTDSKNTDYLYRFLNN